MKVQAESFHLNGHIIGFRPQTQKLESPYKTPSSTLAVKRINFDLYLVHVPFLHFVFVCYVLQFLEGLY